MSKSRGVRTIITLPRRMREQVEEAAREEADSLAAWIRSAIRVQLARREKS